MTREKLSLGSTGTADGETVNQIEPEQHMPRSKHWLPSRVVSRRSYKERGATTESTDESIENNIYGEQCGDARMIDDSVSVHGHICGREALRRLCQRL